MNVDVSILKSVSASVDLNDPQWLLLDNLFNALKPKYKWCESFRVGRFIKSDAVEVVENVGSTSIFWYQRNIVGSRRITTIDRYGLIGLSTLNLKNRTICVTEGVSDFLTMKMCYPQYNVLGFTTLGGNIKSTKILLSLADHLVFICDNDMLKDKNTGLSNGLSLKTFYEGKGKKVTLLLPNAPNKDITQQIISQLK